MKTTQSQRLFQAASQSIAGGVNSPVRAFKSVNLQPLFIERATGSKVYDVDGNEYIDFVGSWGPMILGHNHPAVQKKVCEAAKNGLSFGAPCRSEVILAEKIKSFFPSIDLLRMVNSGTEAAMSAIRLARGFTGKNKIIKFIGCYHGHADFLLVQAGSGSSTLNTPNSAGVPPNLVQDTLLADFNSLEQVEQLVEENSDEIAAIIIEPIAGNMGLITPQNNFLKDLRKFCDLHSILLIFDEVMTGFRVAKGGAQELFSIQADLTILGKIIGGGMPVGAYGGRKDIMDCLAPLGKVYQAGTLSGNPIAMASGIATLEELEKEGVYEELGQKTNWFIQCLRSVFEKHNLHFSMNYAGAMFGFFIMQKDLPPEKFSGDVKNYSDAQKTDQDLFSKLFKQLLIRGVYIAPSVFEAGFISLAHSEEDLQKTVDVFDEALGKVLSELL